MSKLYPFKPEGGSLQSQILTHEVVSILIWREIEGIIKERNPDMVGEYAIDDIVRQPGGDFKVYFGRIR